MKRFALVVVQKVACSHVSLCFRRVYCVVPMHLHGEGVRNIKEVGRKGGTAMGSPSHRALPWALFSCSRGVCIRQGVERKKGEAGTYVRGEDVHVEIGLFVRKPTGKGDGKPGRTSERKELEELT